MLEVNEGVRRERRPAGGCPGSGRPPPLLLRRRRPAMKPPPPQSRRAFFSLPLVVGRPKVILEEKEKGEKRSEIAGDD